MHFHVVVGSQYLNTPCISIPLYLYLKTFVNIMHTTYSGKDKQQMVSFEDLLKNILK